MTQRPNPAKLNEVLRALSKEDRIAGSKLVEIAGDQERAVLLLKDLKKRRLVEIAVESGVEGRADIPETLSISRKGHIVLTAGGYAVGCN